MTVALKRKAPAGRPGLLDVNIREDIHVQKHSTVASAVSPVSVELIGGQPTTTSLDVAAHFGKLHKDVLKRIANLDCSPEFTRRNFAPCTRPGSNNKPEPYYRMTRDGFTFLCMGFTGKEAAKWKEAYINAFNQLERTVAEKISVSVEQGTVLGQRAFQGRHILIAELDGEPWFSAGNLCTALSLGTSDRIVRSLPVTHKRKMQRGSRQLWMVDVVGAVRAADYCSTDLANDYQHWLRRVLSELGQGDEGGLVPPARHGGTALSDHQLYEVFLLSHHFERLYQVFKRHNLYAHLTGLGSKAGIDMVDHFQAGSLIAWNLHNAFGGEFVAVQQRLSLNGHQAPLM